MAAGRHLQRRKGHSFDQQAIFVQGAGDPAGPVAGFAAPFLRRHHFLLADPVAAAFLGAIAGIAGNSDFVGHPARLTVVTPTLAPMANTLSCQMKR